MRIFYQNKSKLEIIKKGYSRHRLLLLSFLFFFLFSTWVKVFATDWPYAPGATLNPGCAPTTVDCNVNGSITGTTLSISGSGTTTVGTPTGLTATQTTGGNDGYPASALNHNYRVYAYKSISAVSTARIYSSSYATLSSNFVDDGLGGSYSIRVSWTAVSGASGYRILKYDPDGFGINYDAGHDVTTNTFLDEGLDEIFNLGSNIVVTPATGYILAGTVTGSLDIVGSISASRFVLGNVSLSGDTSHNFSIGGNTATGGYNNFYVGENAGNGNTSGSSNVFIGSRSGLNATSVARSNFFGYQAGATATNSYDSNFFGYQAGSGATNGNYSNYFGASAGFGGVNTNSSNFFGYGAGLNSTNASKSNFFGYTAGYTATEASHSNFFGYQSGYYATNANNANFFGQDSGGNATNASDANFFGHSSGLNATSASYSNFFGTSAGQSATSASYSNFLGYQAGKSATNSNNAIFIGKNAGLNDTVNNSSSGTSILIGDSTSTGGFSNSIAIGRGTKNASATQLNIGNVIFATGIYNSDTASSAAISGGKVGVGVIAPTETLHVTGAPSAASFVARIANTGGSATNNGLIILAGQNTWSSNTDMIRFVRPDATTIGTIQQNASGTVAYNTSSDARIKENIIDPSYDALANIMNIHVKEFDYINDTNKKRMVGFIAQDLIKVFPDAISTNGDNGTDPLSPNLNPWQVDYGRVTPLIVQAVQKLNLKVEGIMNLLADKVTTKQLCLEDVCINKDQLRTLLNQMNSTPTLSSIPPLPVPVTPEMIQPNSTSTSPPPAPVVQSDPSPNIGEGNTSSQPSPTTGEGVNAPSTNP